MVTILINIKWSLLEYVNKILLILATLNNIFDQKLWKILKIFLHIFQFCFISYTVTQSRSLVMITFLQRKLQLFQCYNKIQNVIKKSLLCGRFSQIWKSFKRWIRSIAKCGLRFAKSEKIRFVTHRFSKIRPIKLAIFFLEICFHLA